MRLVFFNSTKILTGLLIVLTRTDHNWDTFSSCQSQHYLMTCPQRLAALVQLLQEVVDHLEATTAQKVPVVRVAA